MNDLSLPVIPLTITVSLCLVFTFVVFFLREHSRRFSNAERESLLPLAEETTRLATTAPDHDHGSHGKDCGCRSGRNVPCHGCRTRPRTGPAVSCRHSAGPAPGASARPVFPRRPWRRLPRRHQTRTGHPAEGAGAARRAAAPSGPEADGPEYRQPHTPGPWRRRDPPGQGSFSCLQPTPFAKAPLRTPCGEMGNSCAS